MKVMSYNLCCSEEPGHLYADRAAGLKTVVEKNDPDLIGLQEVRPRWMEHLERDYGETYEIWNKYRAESNKEGTPILWKKEKYDCLDRGYFWFSDTPELESKGWDTMGCYRICLWVKLREKETGREFVYFNTHYGFSDACQVASGKLVLAHIREFKLPAFVTADFNMTDTSEGYALLTEVLKDADAETARDFSPTFQNYDLNFDGSRIDFCFYTPETVAAQDYKLLNDRPNGQFISDHYGILATLELK